MLFALAMLSLGFSDPTPPAKPKEAAAAPIRYRGVLKSPGGKLPFLFELDTSTKPCRAWLLQGKSRTELPAECDPNLQLRFEPYGALIEANNRASQTTWEGFWRKPTANETWSRLEFSAQPHASGPLFDKPKTAQGKPIANIVGRWNMTFRSDKSTGILVLSRREDGLLEGTILSTTGDFGYLSGNDDDGRLRLAGFDGAHAFLFHGRMEKDGSLAGKFWSRDTQQDDWTAKRDDKAALPDTFGLVKVKSKAQLAAMKVRDLNGNPHSLDEPAYRGKARIIEISGSWCPNCNDSAELLVELHKKYHARGLSVVTLCFERTGQPLRDAPAIQRFIERHHIEYPVLHGGIATKDSASKKLYFLEKIEGFPTTIFLSEDGTVKAVNTGFSGPATGEEYERLKKRYESLIEEMLAAPSPKN